MLSSDRSCPGGKIAAEKNRPTLKPIAARKPATINSRHPTRCGRWKPSASASPRPASEADRSAGDDRQRQRPRAGLERAHRHARVDQAEEEERDLRGISPPHLELAERVLRIRPRVDEEAGIARGVREKRHDGHERQRRMQAAPVEAQPRHAAGAEQVGPEAAHAQPPKGGGDGDRAADNQRADGQVSFARGVEQRQRHKAQRVGGDAQQQEERHHRVRPEDQPRDEVADRQVRRHGGGPAGRQHRIVEDLDQTKVNQRRHRRRSERRHHRQHGAPPGMEHAARRRGLDDLLRNQREEQRNSDVVDGKRDGKGEAVVALGLDVHPRQREQHPGGQQQQVLDAQTATGAGRWRARDARSLPPPWLSRRSVGTAQSVMPCLVRVRAAQRCRLITPESTVLPVREITWKYISAPATSTSMKLWS